MGHDVSQFVRQHPGQFVVILGQGDQFAGDVDATARNAEGVHLGEFHEGETELQLAGRKMLCQLVP